MAKIPLASQFAWISLIPQFLFMGFLMLVYYLLGVDVFVLPGVLTYLLLLKLLRMILLKPFLRAMKRINEQKFDEAVPYFEESVVFLTEHSWIDKYRYWILLSSSKMSYREMSLCNIAFCYTQTNRVDEAKELYERILNDYPDSFIARSALNLINSIK